MCGPGQTSFKHNRSEKPINIMTDEPLVNKKQDVYIMRWLNVHPNMFGRSCARIWRVLEGALSSRWSSRMVPKLILNTLHMISEPLLTMPKPSGFTCSQTPCVFSYQKPMRNLSQLHLLIPLQHVVYFAWCHGKTPRQFGICIEVKLDQDRSAVNNMLELYGRICR